MKTYKYYLLLFVGSFLTMNLWAQRDLTKEADNSFKGEQYYAAISLYKKAFVREKSKAKKAGILFNIGECYRLTQNPKQAITWYTKAIKGNYQDNVVYFQLATMKKLAARDVDDYEEAKAAFKVFLEKAPGDPRGTDGVKSCDMAIEWMNDPTRYIVQNEVMLNSKNYDFSPTYADKKGKALIFTSTREGATGSSADPNTGESYSDLYYSTRDKKGKWSVPVLINEPVNSIANEGAAALNKRKNLMYFTRCEYAKNKSYTCSVWFSKKMGQSWGEPEKLDLGTDSTTIGHPSISYDDKYLFFAADLPGGQGGKDIWFVTYDKKAKTWINPTNLGPEINTPGNEMFPFISKSGALYFASDGHLGMGGLDNFKAEKTGDNTWGNVENLKYPLNSPANDFGIVIDGDKDRGFFTSDRKGTKGGDDIWSFYMPPVIFAIQGHVTNLKTGEPLADATVELTGSDGSSVKITTDETGFYAFAEKKDNKKERYVLENTSYDLVASKEKFLNATASQTTVGIFKSKTFIHDFALQPFEREIRFPEVRYDLDKWELQVNEEVNSKDSLDFLYQTLIDNPNITIELMAHTDARGSDAYNLELSQKRAQSCVDYLVGKGIAADRLTPKGYGETMPYVAKDGTVYDEKFINSLKTEEEREAAHQKNRRTSFRILTDNYVPKTPPGGEGGSSGGDEGENQPEGGDGQ